MVEELKAYIVGTDGEFDWNVFYVASEEDAIKSWKEEHNRSTEPSVKRMLEWDGKNITPDSIEWFNEGLGCLCHKCGYETWKDADARYIDGNVYCDDHWEDALDMQLTAANERIAELSAHNAVMMSALIGCDRALWADLVIDPNPMRKSLHEGVKAAIEYRALTKR